MVYLAQTYHITSTLQLAGLESIGTAFLAVEASIDTILAAALAVLLYKRRSGIPRTDSILNRMLVYSVGTGLIPTIWAMFGVYAIRR